MASSIKEALSTNYVTARFMLTVAVLTSILCMIGCSIITIDTMNNKPLSDKSEKPKSTAASESITQADLQTEPRNGFFVGIALSGGGSRAANFSSAVLFELEQLKILNKAAVISSVSGSSLPAAYYGLYGRDEKRWNPIEVRELMRNDFETKFVIRLLFDPRGYIYWFTNYNRSDIMKEVLDSNLFNGMTFGEMENGLPRILINGTTTTEGKRFVFSKESFESLNSRIDTYPVANAVMASSAFPGVFHDMTLKDYSISSRQNYEHVLDGGPSDNLGIMTILNMVKKLCSSRKEEVCDKCLLIVVDAYPYPQNPYYVHEADTRRFVDYFIDTNFASTSDALLMARRLDLLDLLKIDARTINVDPFQMNVPVGYAKCAVWHISLQRLLAHSFASRAIKEDENLRRKIKEVADVVNDIPTRYTLTGKDTHSNTKFESETLQDYLFKAAEYLIRLDNDGCDTLITKRVECWFAEKEKDEKKCECLNDPQ
jgi:NTE family protein